MSENNLNLDKGTNGDEFTHHEPQQPAEPNYYQVGPDASHSFNGRGYYDSTGNPTLGIIAFICGIGGFFTGLSGIAAIILGIVSLKRQETPKWWAWTGLALGGLVTLGSILLVLFFLLIFGGFGILAATA